MNIEKLKTLEIGMETLELLSEKLEQQQVKFRLDNDALIEELKIASDTVEMLKDELRPEALQEFEQHPECKKLLGGVGIRVMKDLVYDKGHALKWAKEKDMCLSLNKRAFDTIAKTGQLDFVLIKERATVTFPKKLVLE